MLNQTNSSSLLVFWFCQGSASQPGTPKPPIGRSRKTSLLMKTSQIPHTKVDFSFGRQGLGY